MSYGRWFPADASRVGSINCWGARWKRAISMFVYDKLDVL